MHRCPALPLHPDGCAKALCHHRYAVSCKIMQGLCTGFSKKTLSTCGGRGKTEKAVEAVENPRSEPTGFSKGRRPRLDWRLTTFQLIHRPYYYDY